MPIPFLPAKAPGGGLLAFGPQPYAPTGTYGMWGQGVGGGLLDPSMIQKIADIIKLYGKGGLNPYTEMRDPGAGGGRGLLGSQWRDPSFIQQYEVQQGLRPGSLEPPSAGVRQFATTKAPETLGRQKWSYEDGAGVKREGYFDQSLEGGRTYAFRRPDGKLDLVSGERLKRAQNITTMSPEGPVQTALSQKQAGQAFRNMTKDLWGKMSASDRSLWLRDAKWQSWPLEDQRTFMERFTPGGIGGPPK
jgi:hypothetical protein